MEEWEVVSWIPRGNCRSASVFQVLRWILEDTECDRYPLFPPPLVSYGTRRYSLQHRALEASQKLCAVPWGVKDGQRIHQSRQQNTYALLSWPLGRQGEKMGRFLQS